jgi:hypothetical protein
MIGEEEFLKLIDQHQGEFYIRYAGFIETVKKTGMICSRK